MQVNLPCMVDNDGHILYNHTKSGKFKEFNIAGVIAICIRNTSVDWVASHIFYPLNITGCQVDYSPNCSFSNGLQGKVEYLLVDGTSQRNAHNNA